MGRQGVGVVGGSDACREPGNGDVCREGVNHGEVEGHPGGCCVCRGLSCGYVVVAALAAAVVGCCRVLEMRPPPASRH